VICVYENRPQIAFYVLKALKLEKKRDCSFILTENEKKLLTAKVFFY